MQTQCTPEPENKRICAHCGAPFVLEAPRQRYCSDVCSKAVRRAYRTAYMQHRRGSTVESPVKRPYRHRVVVRCETCDTEVSKPVSQARAARLFCSQDCHNKGQERPIDLACLQCGSVFRRPLSLAHRLFCSNACSSAFRADDDIQGRLLKNTYRVGPVINGAQCLIRPQRITTGGYSCIDWRGRTTLAHIVVWLLANGDVPDRMELSHLCHTPNCIEQAHLMVETHAENMRRSAEAGRLAQKLTSDQVAVIRRRYAEDGATVIALAAEYNIHATTVYGILTRRTWAWVE